MIATVSKQQIPCPMGCRDRLDILYEPTKDIQDPKLLYGAASGVPGTQRLVRCDGCHLIFENPRFPEEAIIDGYKSSEESHHDSQFPMRVESFYRALVALKKQLPAPGALVLDVGTAGGAFLDGAARFGYKTQGLEVSVQLVESGKRRGLNIEQGTLDKAPFAEQSFDMICFWDVLEHVTDPVAVLKQARRFLKPDGVLLINYPDIGTWMGKLAGKKFWWILSVHLVHFNRRSLSRACELAGFKPFLWKPYWQILEVGYLLQISKLYFPKLGGFLNAITPGFIKRLHLSYYASQTTCLAKKI